MLHKKTLVANRAARFHYEILDTWTAGMVLKGTEIKSLRNHGGQLQDAYVLLDRGELFLKNAAIAPYRFGSWTNHEERRTRKLLLHKLEIRHIATALSKKGLSVIPLEIFLDKGLAKVIIAAARGKKLHDKRYDIKARDDQKHLLRALRSSS